MSITLDSIRAAAEAKYGSYDIALTDDTTVNLLNPLRLPKERRDELTALQKELTEASEAEDAASVDQFAIFARMVNTVAKSPAQAEALLAAIDGDLAVLAEIVRGYGKSTQQGEASASAA